MFVRCITSGDSWRLCCSQYCSLELKSLLTMPMISSSNPVVACSGHELSPAQAQGAVLIALGRRQREVAKIVGVTHETVCRGVMCLNSNRPYLAFKKNL